MSNIHYFPRYSQKENMVTNNTMLLFSRLYNNSPEKFRRFINAILEESEIELDTTVRFKQQEKGKGSIPDGMIEQESFKIIIETKLYGQEEIQQIKNHWNAFENEDKQIFLWINKNPISKKYHENIIGHLNKFNEENNLSVGFASTTFKDICVCFDETLQEYDFEMKALIEDFEAFCDECDLIDNADTTIRVVLTGQTFEDNLKNNIYYNPIDRGYKSTKYIGLYKNKAVRAIGETICCVDASYDIYTDSIKIIEVQYGILSDQMRDTLKKVINDARGKYAHAFNEGQRFFFVNEYFITEYAKKSKGGLMGTRYIDLVEVEDFKKEMAVGEIADLLKTKEWNVG